jgi:hypothetical protein
MTDVASLIDLLTKGGLLTALVIALIGGMKGWYVWGFQHKAALEAQQTNHIEAIKGKDTQIEELRKDRDYWRDQAVRTLSAAGRVARVVEATSPHQE